MILKAIFPNFFSKTEKIFVNISFALFLLFLFLAIYQEFENIAGYFASSGIVTLVLNIAVVLIAFILCNLLNIQKPQKKTILIETGLQNGTLAIVVTSLIFSDSIYLVPIATYSLIMYFVIFIYVLSIKFFNAPRETH